MIHFYIKNQKLSFYSPVIAADSLNFLSCRFHFEGEDWQELIKWAHFRQGDTVYDIQLDPDDEIKPAAGLNLHLGCWQVNITGHGEEVRATTDTVILQVKKSGLIDAPLHEMPQSLAEQISVQASSALNYAKAVHEAAERGDFMGQSFQVLGYFSSLTELEAAITQPDRGSVYGVGTAPPYDIYIWDSLKNAWHNNGPIQGAKGDRGDDGGSFIPHVDAAGNLSWTNDAGMENPQTVNIMGPKGDTGPAGADGLSPFEAAVKEGFTGTASTFNTALATMPQHAARHKSGGVDALPAGSISSAMIAANAVSRSAAVTLTAAGWSGKKQTVTASGVTASNTLIVSPAPASFTAYAEAEVRCISQAANALTFQCETVPAAALTVNVTVINK